MKIFQAQSPADIESIRKLFLEYAAGLEIDMCFQNFEQELKDLPGYYAAPAGRLLLAREGETEAGCIALRPLKDSVCEMKRLFVRPSHRGLGLGGQLVATLIAAAREIGYAHMRLDSLPGKMDAAIVLYRSLGFREIPPYYHNPLAGALYMELAL
jgi:putative acetyltransferase